MWRLIFLLFPTLAFGQGSFNIQLLDRWDEDTLISNSTKVKYNDCWGYSQNEEEYAIAGSTEGTHFFQISEDGQFSPVGFVEGKFSSTMVVHRDIKTYLNYAYLVCDEGASSLQIVDLSDLPNSINVVADNDTTFGRVHNLFIDEENALMYACDINEYSSIGTIVAEYSMQVFSLADPENPVLLYTGPGDIPEVHDAYVRDNIAYLNCGADGLRVYDFTNPSAPMFIQNMNFYLDQGYNHQGWLSPDGTKYIFGDETSGKQLKFCSVDENNEVTIEKKFGTEHENGSVAHNIVTKNNLAYVAYYNEGLRIYDLRTPFPSEIAFYDTYPIEEELFKMQGAWGIYADLPSKRLLVSDRHTGLYLFHFNTPIFNQESSDELVMYPNPILDEDFLTLKLNVDEFENFQIDIYNLHGRKVVDYSVTDQSFAQFQVNLATGVYLVRARYIDYLGDEIQLSKKLIVE